MWSTCMSIKKDKTNNRKMILIFYDIDIDILCCTGVCAQPVPQDDGSI